MVEPDHGHWTLAPAPRFGFVGFLRPARKEASPCDRPPQTEAKRMLCDVNTTFPWMKTTSGVSLAETAGNFRISLIRIAICWRSTLPHEPPSIDALASREYGWFPEIGDGRDL